MQLERYDILLKHLRNLHPNIDINDKSDIDSIHEALAYYDEQNGTSLLNDAIERDSQNYSEGVLVGISSHIEVIA